MNLKCTMLSEKSQTQKLRSGWLHLHDVLEETKDYEEWRMYQWLHCGLEFWIGSRLQKARRDRSLKLRLIRGPGTWVEGLHESATWPKASNAHFSTFLEWGFRDIIIIRLNGDVHNTSCNMCPIFRDTTDCYRCKCWLNPFVLWLHYLLTEITIVITIIVAILTEYHVLTAVLTIYKNYLFDFYQKLVK